jgi:hypothetical protein
MYYDEKLINGVLHCRTTPDGEWRTVANCFDQASKMTAEDQIRFASAIVNPPVPNKSLKAARLHYQQNVNLQP